ncbi:MAG: higA [Myxococcales bacterium]|nr:higA [Myxococcales bacterium]
MFTIDRVTAHPGRILLKEFLEPLKMSQTSLAAKLGIPLQRVNEICKGKRGITPETAWLLYKAFNVSPQFWMNLQTNHDLSRTRPRGLTLPRPSRRAA